MATSTILTEKQQTLIRPDENLMFDRERNFDSPRYRLEIAPRTPIDPGTKYVEQGDAAYIHPDSDMPAGPTVEGESFGNIELIREVGGTQEIPRYTNGFTVDEEDLEVDGSFVQDMRDGIMRLFDLQADLAFLLGLSDEHGNEVFSGVFAWLDANIPSDNIIDCSDFDLSTGDLNGLPANVILREAYSKVTGEYVTTQWDVAIAKHEVWALWNEKGTFDTNQNMSQWDLVNVPQDDAGVGVNRRVLIPNSMGLRAPSGMTEKLTFDISMPTTNNSGQGSQLDDEDDDVMYLIPQHDGDFYELYEQPTPDVRGPLMKDGFRERWEYKWRAGVVQDQTHRTDVAADAIKLENVSTMFS